MSPAGPSRGLRGLPGRTLWRAPPRGMVGWADRTGEGPSASSLIGMWTLRVSEDDPEDGG